MKAIVVSNNEAVIGDVPIPQLGENQVLVKTEWVALNPTDWKSVKIWGREGSILGCDFSGTVVELGPGLKNGDLRKGDRIAGMVHGGKYTYQGSFAEYLKVESDLAFKIPDGTTSKVASAFGVPFATAMQVAHRYQGIPAYPGTVVEAGNDAPWYLVYGGSTSVGLFSVQIAKAAGYRVVSTASTKNHELVKEYGADVVIDYRDESLCVSEIKRITSDTLVLAIDCVSNESSVRIALSAMCDSADGHKQLNLLLPQPEETKQLSERKEVNVMTTMCYTLWGKAFTFMPGMDIPFISEDRDYFVQLNKEIPEQLSSGPRWRPNPLIEGRGLEGVLEGLAKLERNEISASKLVYQL